MRGREANQYAMRAIPKTHQYRQPDRKRDDDDMKGERVSDQLARHRKGFHRGCILCGYGYCLLLYSQ